jgi:hypothetical protein
MLPGMGADEAFNEPGLDSEETEILYARGLRRVLSTNLGELKIKSSEKVWVVNKNGGTNTDRQMEALTYDAVVDVLRRNGISEVVARDEDMFRDLYVEYTEADKLKARANDLAENGKLKSADVMLAYRIVRLNPRSPGCIPLGIRFFVAGLVGLFSDAQVNMTDGLRMAIHLDTIETSTGTVRASKIIEHVEPQISMLVTDTVFEPPAK